MDPGGGPNQVAAIAPSSSLPYFVRSPTLRRLLQTSFQTPPLQPNLAPVVGAAFDATKTAAPTTQAATALTMSVAVLTLIVVASLCAIVGVIYMLIYFKSIKPMTARARSYKDGAGGAKGDDDGSRSKSAHPFFRRK
jgi:H+/gluconate symporter-like permease